MKQPAALTFKPGEQRKNGIVRVQIKLFDDGIKYRKWNYRTKRWSKWQPYE